MTSEFHLHFNTHTKKLPIAFSDPISNENKRTLHKKLPFFGVSECLKYSEVIASSSNASAMYIQLNRRFSVAYSQLGPGELNVEVSRSHTIRHTHSRQDSSVQVISPSHRPLITQHIKTQQTSNHAFRGIRTSDRSNQAAAQLQL